VPITVTTICPAGGVAGSAGHTGGVKPKRLARMKQNPMILRFRGIADFLTVYK
jgi:hypothetical protein